jgi:thioredoxin-dependent peroxiredoxin
MMKLLFGLAASICVGASAFAQVKVGDVTPNFSLQGSDGRSYSLAEFRGKKAVVVAWFPKAFNGGCTAECKSLRENSARLRAGDVALFGASVDDAQTNKKFAESLGLDFPLLSDPTKAAATAFGVLSAGGSANRWTFYIGKDGKVAFIDQNVQPSTHGQTVAEKLRQLGIAK